VGPAAQTSASGAATILGRVIEAGSDRGVAGALIRLSADSPTSTAAPAGPREPQPTAITDASGAFLFRDVTPGSYVVTASAPGYFPAAFGQRDPEGPARVLRVRGDRPPPEISIAAWRHGVIAGTMRDEAGDPVVGAAVRALRRTLSGGQVQFVQATTANTDDRGAYRLAGLLPGTYVVLAPSTTTSMDAATATILANEMMRVATSGSVGSSQSPAVAAMMAGGALLTPEGIRVGDGLVTVPVTPSQATPVAPLPVGTGTMQVYRATYHPSAGTITEASVVDVVSGEVHAGTDLTVTLASAHRVSGRLSLEGSTTGHMIVRLMPRGSDAIATDIDFETAVTMSRADGSFMLFGVPPGDYRLKALRLGGQSRPGARGVTENDSTLWGDMPVTVDDSDVSGLVVPLQTGARVRGRLVFAGDPAPTPAEMSRASVSLAPVNGRVIGRSAPAGGRPSAAGTFETAAYPAGQYLLSVRSPHPAWIVRSIVAGGRDITDAALDLTGVADVDDVVVTLTNRPAAISGVVRGAAAAEFLVLVFPGDVDRWIAAGAPGDRIRRVWADEDGAFRVGALSAGAYLVTAVDAASRMEAGDPAVLRRLAGEATAVSITEGAELTVSLMVGTR
jgi:hypothetical protein